MSIRGGHDQGWIIESGLFPVRAHCLSSAAAEIPDHLAGQQKSGHRRRKGGTSGQHFLSCGQGFICLLTDGCKGRLLRADHLQPVDALFPQLLPHDPRQGIPAGLKQILHPEAAAIQPVSGSHAGDQGDTCLAALHR